MTFREGGQTISVPEIVFIVFAFPMGMCMDKYGKTGYLLVAGYFFLVISHLIFYLQDPCTIIEGSVD
jgi:hypothetical protein